LAEVLRWKEIKKFYDFMKITIREKKYKKEVGRI